MTIRATNAENSSGEERSFDSFVFYVGAAIAAGCLIFLVFLATVGIPRLTFTHHFEFAVLFLVTWIPWFYMMGAFCIGVTTSGQSALMRIQNKLAKKRFALITVGFLTFIAVAAVSFTFIWFSWPFLKGLLKGLNGMLIFCAITLIFQGYINFASAVCIRLAARIVCGSARRARPS